MEAHVWPIVSPACRHTDVVVSKAATESAAPIRFEPIMRLSPRDASSEKFRAGNEGYFWKVTLDDIGTAVATSGSTKLGFVLYWTKCSAGMNVDGQKRRSQRDRPAVLVHSTTSSVEILMLACCDPLSVSSHTKGTTVVRTKIDETAWDRINVTTDAKEKAHH